MTIKQLGGVFGRNPTFNDVTIEGQLTFDGDIDVNSDLKVDGNLEVINDLTVDTNSLYVNSTNNEVCIGQLTSINAGKFNVKGDSAHNGISATPYADTYYNYYGTNTAGGSTFYVRGDGISNFQGAMTVEAQLNNTGNHVITNGNVVVSSGYGIDFSATSGTGTSELFDDYEEGTWTPVLTFGGASVGITYSHQTGLYTKIGNVVKFELRIRISSKGTSTGSAVITGLPFSPSSSLNGYVGRQFLCYTSAITASTPVGIFFDTSTSISLYETPGSSLAALNDTDFTTNSYLTITGSYTAA
jgi:hypothetical protein